MNNKQIDDLFKLLESYELAIAALYDTFASVLPQSKDAWITFAKEERLHATWFNKLCRYFRDGKIHLGETKFTSQATKMAIARVEKQTDETLREKPDLRQCLNVAIDIEKSLMESAFFKVFKLTTPETQKIKTQLEDATKSHLERLIRWREKLVKG